MICEPSKYGIGDNSYQMAGKLAGITALVDEFYSNMATFPASKRIRAMHPNDLSQSRQKLAYFLSGWLGGPKLYSQHYGPINIPLAHKHLAVGPQERDAWLLCMEKAVAKQNYGDAFKQYLVAQLTIPAQRISVVSEG